MRPLSRWRAWVMRLSSGWPWRDLDTIPEAGALESVAGELDDDSEDRGPAIKLGRPHDAPGTGGSLSPR